MARRGTLLTSSLTLLTLLLLAPASRAEAQAPRAAQGRAAEQLFSVRLDSLEDRREAGFSLLAEGIFSVGAGALIAGLGYEDPAFVGAGVGTAIWGAVNGLLSLILLDLGGEQRARIHSERGLRGDALEAAIREERSRERQSQQIFSLNTAADLLYIASGVFLYAFGQSSMAGADGAAIQGYALAQLLQGSFLFLFDMGEWIDRGQSFHRAGAIRP